MSALQIRRGTASAIATANPTLAAGEPVLETDTGLLKIGDGTTAWTSLPYYHPGIPVGGSTGQVLAKASGSARDTEWITPAAPAVNIPTFYTVSAGTYLPPTTGLATVTVFGAPSTISSEFTYTTSTGILEAPSGIYQVSFQLDVGSAGADAVCYVQVEYKVGAGSWTLINGGFARNKMLPADAGTPTRMFTTALFDATGDVEFRVRCHRESGSGTLFATAGLFSWFVQRLGDT